MKEINKIFIANRGEIAVRIIRAARSLGISTVTAYTTSDADSLHVRLSDKAVLLPENDLASTFLSPSKMLSVALAEACDAIHPGYGFISEEPEFAKLCNKAGIIFIGPSIENIQLLGNKTKARSFAKSIGIPIIGGLSGSVEDLLEDASHLDFPVIIKPLAGGGGKGIFVVEKEELLKDALQKAGREASNYFNNSELYIEHFFEHARHIEVQLLGDKHGNLVHLYDRECSLQRRYQKIIEEAPSATISENTREKILKAALSIGKTVDYFSAGTVEFLLDKNENFYFLEMNTRIQVEHGVTEMITGVDIVQEQIHIAQGKKLSLTQKDISINGHAIEARLYAEDPDNNFLPVQGVIKKQNFPINSNGRFDTHLTDGMLLPLEYDSLLAKIMGWGKTRELSIQNLSEILEESYLFGLKNNLQFLCELVSGIDFKNKNFHTRYIQEFISEKKTNSDGLAEADWQKIAIAYLIFHFLEKSKEAQNIWEQIGYWRCKNEIVVHINGKDVYLGWLKKPEYVEISIHGRTISMFDYQIKDGIVAFRIKDQKYQLPIFKDKDSTYIHYLGVANRVVSKNILEETKINKEAKSADSVLRNTIHSPMFGKVVALNCKGGDRIKKGEILLVLESMKIENNIICPFDAVVVDLQVNDNEQVSEHQLLVELEPMKEKSKIIETQLK